MKTVMRDPALKEKQERMLSERRKKGDELIEKWSKKRGLDGKQLIKTFEQNPDKARSNAFVMENMKRYLTSLNETQISQAFGHTPENVMRIVTLGYDRSIRGEIFLDWGMQTAHDSIYYLSPIYARDSRGATGDNVTHESDAYRYASELEHWTAGTGDGTTTTFTGTINTTLPVRPYSVHIMAGRTSVANDDGNGNLTGDALDSAQTNTIDYDTGDVTLNFTTAPDSGNDIVVEYAFDSEEPDNWSEHNLVHLRLRDYHFRARPWPLGISYTTMAELQIGTTLGIDGEEAMLRGAADELSKSLDFYALRLGYNTAKKKAAVNFDTTAATGESEVDRAQAITRAIDNVADQMFDNLNRGGVTRIYGGPHAVTYLKHHRRFRSDGSQSMLGPHRVGELDGISIYKVPSALVPTNELTCVYRNEDVPEDVSIAFGTLLPLYQTQKTEFRQLYSERGLAYFGDVRVLQPQYLGRVVIQNL